MRSISAPRPKKRRRPLEILPCTPIAETIAHLVKERAAFEELTVIGIDKLGQIRIYTTSQSPLETTGLLAVLQHELVASALEILDVDEDESS